MERIMRYHCAWCGLPVVHGLLERATGDPYHVGCARRARAAQSGGQARDDGAYRANVRATMGLKRSAWLAAAESAEAAR